MRLGVYTALVWFAAQVLWLALVLSFLDGPGSGGFRGVLLLGVVLLPPIGLGFAFARGWRRAVRRATEVEAELARRAIRTRGGFRLVPASGLTPDDPIVCLERDPSRIPAAEFEYVREQVSPSAALGDQELLEHGGRMIDVLTVQVEGGSRRLHFDVSRSWFQTGGR